MRADYQKILELEPQNAQASAACERLPPLVAAQREKEKEEMLSKLKDLGNTVLGKFGMSIDNFQAVKGGSRLSLRERARSRPRSVADPATGSYSINYKPNK